MGGAGAPEQASDRVGGLCSPPLPSSLPPCPALRCPFLPLTACQLQRLEEGQECLSSPKMT